MDKKTDQTVPDPATIYERAKPAQQSPDGKLTTPPPQSDDKADNLTSDAAPARHPHNPHKSS